MDSITIALALLLAVILSGTISRLSPFAIPLPLIQIAFGALIAVATGGGVELEPDIFFLLFLPPLLFLDGWRIPKEGLFRDKGVILELALGLVIFTVLGVGLLIHWLIPAMPLAVAFALAAIVSPTDPIAVSAIAARVPIPHRLMHILEGESLLNDASGLVCMRFAVAAALTGTFSLVDAVGSFLWLAIGGIAIGFAVVWVAMKAKEYVSRKLGEDTGSQILLSLLLPFGAYLAAEHLHCSGILAAVAAGVTMSYMELRGKALAKTRVGQGAVWDTVQFALNGMIFVLFGEQLPRIVSGAARIVTETGHLHPIWLLIYVLTIYVALVLLRFGWVWVSLRFTMYRAARLGRQIQTPPVRLLVAASLAGVRGAITLAGILTLPLFMNDGTTPFPARDLAIFLAAGVIVVSLIVASVGLPAVLKDLELPPQPDHHQQEDEARIAAAKAAIRMIDEMTNKMSEGRTDADRYSDVGTRLMEFYRHRIEGHGKTGEDAETVRKLEEAERRLRLAALRAERDEYYRLGRKRQLPDDVARKLVREIDLMETRFTI
ncbi:sodium/proton antiporter, CPA1 family (TC 2.A.36) [Rhizobium sp. NFR07]|uniref:Na+/H+ antiporter n=1 Tax=Rhizobium sp. NFR07 TaxID=1566262 RepID=UPI0008E7C7B7|nr:Na+/H+ antiporter [Rhizobium sp. NFR07]SFB05698.1 sodium/proton antiporter, CPA1 family (TC 2.A.36) [Rhizobium sp. NFR07]